MLVNSKWAIEVAYMYSNHIINDAIQPLAVYHKLDQHDVSVAAKYYFFSASNKFRPYLGADATYINRKYTDRIYQSWVINNYSTTESTQAVDLGVLAGVDFAISDEIVIGAGVDYNFNVMNVDGFDERNVGGWPPGGIQELEKIDYWTLKISAKFIF